MFTAPTAIRAIAREDQEGHLAKKYSLDSLTSLFLAGERSDPQTLRWCQTLVGDRCTVIDNYWSTECEYEKEKGGGDGKIEYLVFFRDSGIACDSDMCWCRKGATKVCQVGIGW